jgi:transposase, IS5 family
MYEIQRMTTRQRQDQQTATYRALIGIAEEVVTNAKTVLKNTAMLRGKDLFANLKIDATRERGRALLRSRRTRDRPGAPPRAQG